MSTVKATTRPAVRVALAAAYFAATIILAACGIGLWRTRCEGFGCTGLGIAWLAWGALCAVVFGFGCFSHFRQSGQLRRIMRVVLALQALGVVSLVAHWIHRGTA